MEAQGSCLGNYFLENKGKIWKLSIEKIYFVDKFQFFIKFYDFFCVWTTFFKFCPLIYFTFIKISAIMVFVILCAHYTLYLISSK